MYRMAEFLSRGVQAESERMQEEEFGQFARNIFY